MERIFGVECFDITNHVKVFLFKFSKASVTSSENIVFPNHIKVYRSTLHIGPQPPCCGYLVCKKVKTDKGFKSYYYCV